MHKLLLSKHTGLLLPLFSMYSKDDFGCGDISSLSKWLDFFKELGLDIVQILPINELPPQTNCPYTALTAFAIDPIYISIKDIRFLSPKIEKKIKSKEFQSMIKDIKKQPSILYDDIRMIKYELLFQQYNFFVKELSISEPKLREDFEKYVYENSWWLDDYAVFRKLKDVYSFISWEDWPFGLRDNDNSEIERFKKENEFEINFFKYIQWEIEYQISKIKEIFSKANTYLFGDIPFMVNKESADVWSRRYDFRLDFEIGAPPDEFSKEGQRWGLPAPNWQSQVSNNFEWWRLKLKKFSKTFDIFRIDHMVGFFRTWVIPKNGDKPDFDILDPILQEERGRLFLKTITNSTDMLAVAEDLGVIPPYVRKVMKEFDVPGYKVLRWEKENNTSYIDPKDYEPISLATTSTHDTQPMNSWWKEITLKERERFMFMLYKCDVKPPSRYKDIKDKVNEKVLSSPSRLVIFTVQDIISSDDRINTPGTVGPHNWTYRIRMEPERFYEKHKKDFDIFKMMVKKLRK